MGTSLQRAVLTIATGRMLYWRLAVNLARSFMLWHKNSDIKFYLATDIDRPLPHDLSDVSIVRLPPGQLGTGFSPKLHLDEIAPAQRTLFIDSDCLCVGNLDDIFDQFYGHSVASVGSLTSTGEWFGDIEERCRRFDVPSVPVFVGSIYYLEKGETCKRVFSFAREVEQYYDQAGFVRLRGVPNEEPLVSIAMARNMQEPLGEDGTIKADAMMWSVIKCNVLEGIVETTFTNTDYDLIRGVKRETCPDLLISKPKILHFNDRFTTFPPYTSEVMAMALVKRLGLNKTISRGIARLSQEYPYWLETKLKNTFRPLYRRFLGTRNIHSAR